MFRVLGSRTSKICSCHVSIISDEFTKAIPSAKYVLTEKENKCLLFTKIPILP